MEDIPKQTPEFSRRRLLVLGALGMSAIITGSLAYASNHLPTSEYPLRSSEFARQPSWNQEFKQMNATTIDTSVWRYDTDYRVPTYNNEAQAYTDWSDNVRIEQGTGLIIEAHRRDYQYPNDAEPDVTQKVYEYTSGRIDTLESFTFEYGKVEARMKLPAGRGVWPAFWLLSGNEIHSLDKELTEVEENDPRRYTLDGEIDIMEYYGNNPDEVEATVHTYDKSVEETINIPDATTEFHTYGVEVAPNSITWTIDGKPYHYFEKPSDDPAKWPFGDGNEFYIILNLAMGGPAGPTQPGQQSWQLQVENVRFYPFTGKVN
ncbi:MAG: glycoside hydrolase family 16 protein [Patescibacteria group bacterium]